MSTFEILHRQIRRPAQCLVAFFLIVTAGSGLADETPNLGTPLSAAEVQAADITVMPDGEGLPPGSGNAEAGAAIYAANCLACHGSNGTDGLNDRLAGGHGSIDTDRPQKTVGSYWPYATTLFDYVRRAMPYQTPGSLSNDELYAVTAYVLFLNGIVGEEQMLDRDTLTDIRMPNRDNFVWAYEP